MLAYSFLATSNVLRLQGPKEQVCVVAGNPFWYGGLF